MRRRDVDLDPFQNYENSGPPTNQHADLKPIMTMDQFQIDCARCNSIAGSFTLHHWAFL